MTNKILRKTTSAIFLAIVLVAGTFAAISPSFITGVNAQGETYNYGMNDIYDEKSYGNSYEQDSYGKDRDYDKSKKDSSNSVSISKINCNNVNVIGNVNGDISVGNDGRESGPADFNRVLKANNGERYYDGYQKGKDITCIINNNNTIIADGNETTSEPETCEECFTTILEPEEIDALLEILAPNITSLEQFCGILLTPGLPEEQAVRLLIIQTGASPDEVDSLIECLISIGVIFEEPIPPT